jgi:hypothetical protein
MPPMTYAIMEAAAMPVLPLVASISAVLGLSRPSQQFSLWLEFVCGRWSTDRALCVTCTPPFMGEVASQVGPAG